MSTEPKETRVRRLAANYTNDLGQLYSVFRIKLSWYAIIKTEQRHVSALFYRIPTNEIDLEVTATLDDFKPFLDPLMSEITRNFINDLFNITCEFNIYLRNLLKGKKDIFDYNEDDVDGAINFSNKFLTADQKLFVDFLRLVRNTMVHHGGRHNVKNKLNHKLMGRKFITEPESVDKPIEFYLSELIEFYKQLTSIFSFENLYKNEHFRSLLRE